MTTKRHVLIAGAAVAALTAAAALAVAHSGPGRSSMGMDRGIGKMSGQHGAGMGWHDPSERLSAAKIEIGIKPEQTAAWDEYVKIVTETAAERRRVHQGVDRDAVQAMKPEDRQAFHDAMMKQRDEASAKIRTAAETFLAQLDDAQKVKARDNLPGLAEDGSRRGMRHGMAGDRGHGSAGQGMRHGDDMGPRWKH